MVLELCATQSLVFAVKLKVQRDKVPKEQFRFVFVGFLHCRRNRGKLENMLIIVGFRTSDCMMMLVEHCKKPRCSKIGLNRCFFKL